MSAIVASGPMNGRHARDGDGIAAPSRSIARRRSDELHFRLICGATLPFFLLAALVVRLVPARRPGTRAAARRSIFREAQAAAQTCASFALMG